MSSFREDLPSCAESVDFLKTLFGADIKVEAAYEGEKSIVTKAKLAEETMIEIDGDHYLRLGNLAKTHDAGMQLAEDAKRGRK